MSLFAELRLQAKALERKILLPEHDDPRVIQAARELISEQLATPVFLHQPEQAVPGSLTIDDLVKRSEADEHCIQWLVEKNSKKALTSADAQQLLQQPLIAAAALLKLGYADAAVSGSIATTGNVIKAGLTGLGLAANTKIISSIFLMEYPDKVFTYGDCGVIPDPDAEQLAQIAINSAAAHRALTGQTAKIGMLSFSTHGSASHPSVDKVIAATRRVRELAPSLLIDGELQYDAATVPEVARQKAPNSDTAGDCNVLIFPDLNAGNIAYKLGQRVGGARAAGPLLLGFAKPWMDLSRGCSASDIVDVSVIGALLAN